MMPADLQGSIMPYLPDACMGFPSALLLPWSLVATSLPSRTPAPGPLCAFMCPPLRASLHNHWTTCGARITLAVAPTLGQARVPSRAGLAGLRLC